MYSLLKNIITEKDIYRQIVIVEQLLNFPSLTVKDLSQETKTSERTIFSDLQLIRDQLPDGWKIDSGNYGIKLINEKKLKSSELWSLFLNQSVSIKLIKELFFLKNLTTVRFVQENGLTFETLKRHHTKINNSLKVYNIKIKITPKKISLLGDETSIRVFYHRLLTPFIQNNYFFQNYKIHAEYYYSFLKKLKEASLFIDNEQIFGMSWFFINTIRIKANCRIDHFIFDKNDPMYLLYNPLLSLLYKQEGIYIENEESFFAFFCFLESWNYDNAFNKSIDIVDKYPILNKVAIEMTDKISKDTKISLSNSNLTNNFLLLLLKYNESTWLSEHLQIEFHELLTNKEDNFSLNNHEVLPIIEPILNLKNPLYLLNIIFMLKQQALYAMQPEVMTAYFIFHGEPAWKLFLFQELNDLIGNRVTLTNLELSNLTKTQFNSRDIVISNIALDLIDVPIIYISNIPTKNELNQLTELTMNHYL